MKSRIPCASKMPRHIAAYILVLGATTFSGCATYDTAMGSGTHVTASDKARMSTSGFLSDYSRLKAIPEGDGVQCWRNTRHDLKSFDKVMISNIMVTISPPTKEESNTPVDPSDLKILTDYFHDSLARSLAPQMQLVKAPSRDVVVIRIVLTDLVPTSVLRSAAGTLTPYGFVAEAGSGVATGRPAGSTPYLGQTSMEIQFVDGGSGSILGECRDTQIGRKYAADLNANTVGAAQTWASGYINSFQSWSYAKNAFDKWSALIALRFGELRGTGH
jgi:hypothetical protein